MIIEKGYIYHIYNQGNNRRRIFLIRENYLFFLKKIETYILPYADILAYCLMPNHFHLMVYVRELEVVPGRSQGFTPSEALTETGRSKGFTPSEALTETGRSKGFTLSEALTGTGTRSFNHSIGIMLRSYTRAINKQHNFSGALFRKNTKAECLNCNNEIFPAFFSSDGATLGSNQVPEKQYPQVCFNYIHQNPVKAGLVNNAVEWEFSSAMDYAGLRNGRLVNKNLAAKSGLHLE
jgi:putative transposase